MTRSILRRSRLRGGVWRGVSLAAAAFFFLSRSGSALLPLIRFRCHLLFVLSRRPQCLFGF